MPDASSRAPRRAWRGLALAGAFALALAAAVAATGGIDWSVGALRLRAHEPWRLLAAGLGLVGAALWLGGAQAGAALSRAWDTRERHAARIAAASAAITLLVGLVKGTRVAGGADAYGYVSQALLWLKGLPVQAESLAAVVPWPGAEWSLSPLGYRPGLEPGMIVPTYPPGLPLAMAAAAGIGGTDAVYWVVPVLGAAAVWLTFLLGRRYADAGSGAAAALLVAASPVFLYQLVQPMSDVPVTACWLLSLWGAASGRPCVAGLGAAAAVLTRLNLAPLALPVAAAVAVQAFLQHRTLRAALRAALVCALPLALAAAFLAWLHTRLYGSPLASGYGAASELFAAANVPVNAVRYTRWLVDTQTPLVLLGLAAPFAARSRRPGHPGASLPAQAWFGLGFAALVLACYLPYSPFEEWWYLRFLLPAIPVLLILAAPILVRLASAAPAVVRAPLVAAGVGLLAWQYVATAGERSAFALDRLESRYLAAGAFASRNLPDRAVLLSMQESGPLRMYGGRTTVRFDHLEPNGLDAAVQFLNREGYPPYFVLEAWEEAGFRERFAASSPLGLLDWPPMAEVGRPVKVRFYDPRDRGRFLAGEAVATAREPMDGRGRR
ncbi:MAG: hypothetical protein R6V57_01610 [Vicinamibacterales bacterium]